MIFDRQKQRLLLEGKEYTPGDIHSLVAEGEETTLLLYGTCIFF